MSEKDFGKIFITNTSENLSNKKASEKNNILKLKPEQCFNWKYADRSKFELGNIQELAEDIKKNGQIQPVLVRKSNKNGLYEVIAGERRWRACGVLEQEVLPIEVDKDDLSAFLAQHSENKRKDLSPYSKCMSYAKLINDNVITQNQLADQLGYKKSSFSELMSYSSVPLKLWEAVDDVSKVSISTASYIRKLINEDKKNIKKLIKISDKIKNGAGKKKIEQLIKNSVAVVKEIKNNQGELLFKFSDNKIEFSKRVFSFLTMDDVVEFINKHIEKKEKQKKCSDIRTGQ